MLGRIIQKDGSLLGMINGYSFVVSPSHVHYKKLLQAFNENDDNEFVKWYEYNVTKEEYVAEASVSAINKDDVETKAKDADGAVTKDKKEKKTDKDAVDAKEVKGGKTEVWIEVLDKE